MARYKSSIRSSKRNAHFDRSRDSLGSTAREAGEKVLDGAERLPRQIVVIHCVAIVPQSICIVMLARGSRQFSLFVFQTLRNFHTETEFQSLQNTAFPLVTFPRRIANFGASSGMHRMNHPSIGPSKYRTDGRTDR